MFHTNGASAGGGLVSSSAVLLVIIGACVVFLAHRGISDWVASRHSAVREHLYGPEDLYEPVNADHTEAEESNSETEGGAGDPDDGFDYSIFATDPPNSQ